MADSYYYQANGQTIGPLAPSALKQLANEGVIVASTLVRKGEQGAWYQAGTIAGLVSPRPVGSGASSASETDAVERARQTFRVAEEQAEKVAAKLWFLDLKFSRFFTPKLIGPLWAAYLCMIAAFFLFSMVEDLVVLKVFLALMAIGVQFVALVFEVIAGRVILEVVLVIFRMGERLEAPKPSEHVAPIAGQEKST